MKKVGMTRTSLYRRVKEYEETLANPTEKDTKYSIGNVAKMTGTTVPTVRYYDQIGLLKPAEVTTGRYRLYTMEEIWRLKIILTLRNLGFGLEEVRKLISGETSVDTVIDWQMEALDTQIRTLTSVKSILEQTQQSDYGEDSINYLHELVQSISVSTEERKRFINEKIIASVVPDQVPVEWKKSFMGNSNDVFTKKGKLSAQQTAALLEIEELLDDPQFVADIRHGIEIAMNTIKHTRIDAATWSAKMNVLFLRLLDAVKQKESPDSSIVQAIVNEHASLFANTEQLPVPPEFFRQFAKGWLKLENSRIDRYVKLCSILHPPVKLEVKARSLLMKGMQWKLEHLEAE
ncbi:MerR family transcriptional regulator [uncultured Brevibacillus sp.]|uniref:MerR family transcriptional regulator n=1 Tax=uncultured Brevibacillus sp. TaxID=169970 RepID=UPI0025914875|nr:MerR family transcriptional regulator [uncultured Brevibacillus sp.]